MLVSKILVEWSLAKDDIQLKSGTFFLFIPAIKSVKMISASKIRNNSGAIKLSIFSIIYRKIEVFTVFHCKLLSILVTFWTFLVMCADLKQIEQIVTENETFFFNVFFIYFSTNFNYLIRFWSCS